MRKRLFAHCILATRKKKQIDVVSFMKCGVRIDFAWGAIHLLGLDSSHFGLHKQSREDDGLMEMSIAVLMPSVDATCWECNQLRRR